ncbi:MAG: phospholipase [Actinobacteria bacterium]|nr:phospholipase [Actinomycetota bacterium]
MKSSGNRRNDLVYRIDKAVGDGLERVIRAHHRRRLGRIGWSGAFDPSGGIWCTGDPPPREGNSIDVLIDGAEAFPAIVEALRAACSSVYFAGWHVTPDFVVSSSGSEVVAAKKLFQELGEEVDVRILLWAGAPLPPPFSPSRRGVRSICDELGRGRRTLVAVDSKERPLHCRHEKIIVIDGELAFVGGIDMTNLAGDRMDSNRHPARGAIGWHDATTRLRGPIVADVARHFEMRWGEVTGEWVPPTQEPAVAGNVEVQIVRTVPEKIYASMPRGDFRILEAYVRALRAARHFIYLENQFLWSSEIVKILADKLHDPPSEDFRLLMLLPAKPSTGMDDTLGQLAVLEAADGGAGRMLACTLYASDGAQAQPVYIHAKIGVVDDHWLTIGSANLNNHSLFNDSEMNVITRDGGLARATRLRLWAEHLERSEEDVAGNPTDLFEELWRPIAQTQLELRETGAPLTHRLVQLPHVSKRAKRLLGPLQTMIVDG